MSDTADLDNNNNDNNQEDDDDDDDDDVDVEDDDDDDIQEEEDNYDDDEDLDNSDGDVPTVDFNRTFDALLERVNQLEQQQQQQLEQQLEESSEEEDNDDDEDEDMDDDDDYDDEDQYNPEANNNFNNTTILPRPRDHSYLQGSSHPLLGSNMNNDFATDHHHSNNNNNNNNSNNHPNNNNTTTNTRRKRCSSSSTASTSNNIDHNNNDDNTSTSSIVDLAILELNGVVLFPGSTIPIKLCDRSMIQYLGRQIDLCRNTPHIQNSVRLGILTYQNELHQRQRRELRQERRNNSTNNNTSDDDDDEDDIDGDEDETNNNDTTINQRRRRQRRRVFSNNNNTGSRRRWFQRRRRTNRPQQQQQQQQDDDGGGGDEDDDEGNQESSVSSRPTRPPQHQQHRFIGRIGTIATIQYTHERTTLDDDDSDDDIRSNRAGRSESSRTGESFSLQRSLWGRYEQTSELVFTAVGTSRFKVIGCRQQGSDMIDYRVFQVEELIDQPLILPPILRRPGPLFSSLPPAPPSARPLSTSSTTTQKAGTIPSTSSSVSSVPSEEGKGNGKVVRIGVQRQNQLTWNLSLVTPVPHFVYQQYWPWKIVESLVETLKASDGKSNLPTLDIESSIEQQQLLKEPMKFSFWMASNLPLSENERLDLLEMHSTYERLKLIENHVNELTKNDSYIGCKQCGIIFTNVSNVFTVGGAEAATSTYVNRQGYIHQITTLRDVDDRKLFFDGYPSTENSYFPGYSWTITYCRRCTSLLGWKFLRVNRRPKKQRESPDSPNMFYGFMSSNVTHIEQ